MANALDCSNCGLSTRIERGSYQFRESGLENVVLQGIEIVRCDHCGNEDPIIPHVNELMRALAFAVIAKPYRLRGADVRFLRKYLGLTSVEFARLINIDKTHVSKWENGRDVVGPQSDRLIRVIALIMGDGLKEKLDELVKALPHLTKSRQDVGIGLNAEDLSYEYV